MSIYTRTTMSLTLDDSNNSMDNKFDRIACYYNTFKPMQSFDIYNNIYKKEMSTTEDITLTTEEERQFQESLNNLASGNFQDFTLTEYLKHLKE
jgi:type V secretory pathway adhesin AidA